MLSQPFCIHPGAHFTNNFSIVIQIRLKIHYAPIEFVDKWSLLKFAHGTTAVLSWHVQNFLAIWYPTKELNWNQLSIRFLGKINGKMFMKWAPEPDHIREGKWVDTCTLLYLSYILHPRNGVHHWSLIALCCGIILVHFTYIPQCHCTGTRTITRVPTTGFLPCGPYFTENCLIFIKCPWPWQSS